MKKKLMKMTAGLVLGVMVTTLNSGFMTFASKGSGTVRVPTNKVMVPASTFTRSGSKTFVNVKVNSVYPTEEKPDTYENCIAQIYSAEVVPAPVYKYPISDPLRIKEGTGHQQLPIYASKLSQTTVVLYFSGNSPQYAAHVVYEYDGL